MCGQEWNHQSVARLRSLQAASLLARHSYKKCTEPQCAFSIVSACPNIRQKREFYLTIFSHMLLRQARGFQFHRCCYDHRAPDETSKKGHYKITGFGRCLHCGASLTNMPWWALDDAFFHFFSCKMRGGSVTHRHSNLWIQSSDWSWRVFMHRWICAHSKWSSRGSSLRLAIVLQPLIADCHRPACHALHRGLFLMTFSNHFMAPFDSVF